jgi:hypothetical protein
MDPASCRNWIPISLLLNRNVRKVLFASPEYPCESRWYYVFGMHGISRSLSLMTLLIWCTIFMTICHFVLHTVATSWITMVNWCLKDAFECGLMGKRRSNLDSSVGRNWEGKKCGTCHKRGRSSNKFSKWNNLKPLVTSVLKNLI